MITVLAAFSTTYLDSFTMNCSLAKDQYTDQCCKKSSSTQFKLKTPWIPHELLEQVHTPEGGWRETDKLYEGLYVPPSQLYAVDPSLPDMRGLWQPVSASFTNGTTISIRPFLKRVEQIGKRTAITSGGIVHDCVANSFDGRVNDVSVVDFESRIEVMCLTKHDERGPVLVHSVIKPLRAPEGAGVERWMEVQDGKEYLVSSRPSNQQILGVLSGTINMEDVTPIITRFERVSSVF
jgi:hypothetical protein